MKPLMKMTPSEIKKLTELEFEQRIQFENPDMLLHRIPDTADNYAAKGTRNAKKQPGDYLCLTNQHLFVAEVKGTTNQKGLSTSNFQPLQKGWMKKAGKCQSRAYFVFIKDWQHDRWFKIPQEFAATMVEMKATYNFNRIKKEYLWTIPQLDNK